MKIYIASSFRLLGRVVWLADELEKMGHEITVKWWAREYEIPGERKPVKTTELKERYEFMGPDEFYARPETRLSYEADFKGVKDSQALILMADDEPRKYNGANIELGIAIGDNKPCFSLGALENSVLYYPVIKCRTFLELLSHLEEIK